jgi:hypothetical protein
MSLWKYPIEYLGPLTKLHGQEESTTYPTVKINSILSINRRVQLFIELT